MISSVSPFFGLLLVVLCHFLGLSDLFLSALSFFILTFSHFPLFLRFGL